METLALCIPAYNAAAYLPRLLASAAAQAIPFTEILVYDDCSTDNTAEIATKYGATVIYGDVNRGCSYGKNVLTESTTCQWIHFHDADDELLPNFTALAYNWINSNFCPDVVLFNYEYRDNETGELLSTRKFDAVSLKKDPIAYAITEQINPFCGLYRRSSLLNIGGYDINPLTLHNEDAAFHIKLAINNLSFGVEEEISIVNYRITNSMSAGNTLKCLRAQYHVLEQTAATHGHVYAREISQQLQACIARLAAGQDWQYVKKAIALNKALSARSASENNDLFTQVSRLHPFTAVWLREKLIRWVKPSLRK